MAQPTKRVISGSRTKNNGGTVFGSNPSGLGQGGFDRPFIGVGLSTAGYKDNRFWYLQDVSNVKTARSGVSFAKMDQGDYVVTGLFNIKLNARAAYGASYPGYDRGRHLNFNVRTRRIVTAGWNYFTGDPLTTPTLSHDSFVRSGSATIDNRLVPGKMVVHRGAFGLPTSSNYAEKTG